MFSGIKTSLMDSDFHFHNDFNSTVQWLHQHVSDEHSKHLTLADDSKLEKILHSKAAFHDNNFSSLRSLVVNNVTKDHLISSQVLLCLKSLEELEVVPKLKELTVNEESIILLSHANLPQDLFRKLNLLLLCQEDEDEDNRKDTLPFDFLLKVEGDSVMESTDRGSTDGDN
ncbi:hypothetical protein V8G54_019414 [Vigna mungo]|uniref:Disease resistance protein At4g27190-like leucine-rich repeats domain-containing protein n=1 Tax=Vigna mungo TaxID=3915 RepID=A0AAQ3NCZ5_VIGMU